MTLRRRRAQGRVALPDISVTAGQLTSAVSPRRTATIPTTSTPRSTARLGAGDPPVLHVDHGGHQPHHPGRDRRGRLAERLATEWSPPVSRSPGPRRASGSYMATNRAMIPVGAANVEGAEFIDYLLRPRGPDRVRRLVGDLPVHPAPTSPPDPRRRRTHRRRPDRRCIATLDPSELVPTRRMGGPVRPRGDRGVTAATRIDARTRDRS